MASPPQTERPEPPIPGFRVPPGSFVTGEMQEECARFLAEVRSLVHRRSERQRPELRNLSR